jgi:hypothetical protein
MSTRLLALITATGLAIAGGAAPLAEAAEKRVVNSALGAIDETSLAQLEVADDEGVVVPRGLSPIFARPAVDHVITYAWSRGFGPKGGDRITIWRHGAWVREDQHLMGSRRPFEQEHSTTFSNVDTGASLSGILPVADKPGGVSVWRSEGPGPTHKFVPTGQTRTIAGEQCAVWRADPLPSGIPHEGCIAPDGVVLHQSWLFSGGEIGQELTAVKIERRPVPPTSVLPPDELLNWDRWLKQTEGSPPVDTGQPKSFEVRLKQTSGQIGHVPKELRYRAGGGWLSSERWVGGTLKHLALSHSSGSLTLTKSEGSLSIGRGPPRSAASIASGVKLLDRLHERVLGETCAWVDTAVGVSDYSRLECHTSDRLPLLIIETSWGHAEEYVAVSITRGLTRQHELMPSGMLEWTQWGWPELQD